MEWEKWVIGVVGTVVVGIVTNGLWDALKSGGRLARDWQRQQVEQSRQTEQIAAQKIAQDTQRLVMWVGMMVLGTLALLSLAVMAMSLQQLWEGRWLVWLPTAITASMAIRTAIRGMRTIQAALDHLIATEQAGDLSPGSSAPSAEHDGQSPGS